MSARETFRIAVRKFPPFESAIQEQWRAFRENEPGAPDLEAVALDLHPLHAALFAEEGLKRGDWDAAFVSTDWVAEAFESGAALDLAPLLSEQPPEGYPDAWTPSLLRAQRFGEAVIGLPYHDGPECLIYRKDLYEDPREQRAYQARCGAPLRLPETWEEFARQAEFFHRPDDGLFGTVFAAYPDGHNAVYDYCLQLWTRGGELMEGDRLALESTASLAGLEFYRRMLTHPAAVHPDSRRMESVQSGFAFAAGQAALMINWFGFAAMCQTLPESKVKDRVGVADLPRAPGAQSASLNVYWLLCVGAGSPRRELAYRFLRHCAGAEMDKRLTLAGGIGCRKSTWSDPEVNRAIPFYRRMEGLHARARELPRLSRWACMAEIIDGLVLEAINSDRPIPELARRAQARADALGAR